MAGAAGTIKEVWKHNEEQDGREPQAAAMSLGVPRFTLTAFGDRIFARMGPTTIPLPEPDGRDGRRRAAELDRGRRPERPRASCSGRGRRPRSPARRKPAADASRDLGFEGTPVADARSVYVGDDRPQRA